MLKTTLSVLAICSLALAACSSSGDDNPSETIDSIEGIWVAPAYGVALTIEPNQFKYYQYTGLTCQTFNNIYDETYEQLLQDVELEPGGQTLMNSFFGGKVPAMQFDRQPSLPDSCVSSKVANLDEDGYEDDPVRDFDIFWQNFNDHYAFFELKQIDWAQQRDRWRAEVTADTSDDELFGILAQMITPLADGHVSVSSFSADEELDFSVEGKTTYFDIIESEHEQLPPENEIGSDDYFDQQIELSLEIIADSFEEDATLNIHESEQAAWSVLPNNIGYLNLFAMGGFSDSDLPVDQLEAIDLMFDQILNDLANVDSMIIDLRLNGGGSDGVSLHIASRFTDARTLAWKKQARLGDLRLPLSDVFVEPTTRTNFLKPVVLLTSTATGSAAEVFVLAMQQVRNATLVGEATNGILSDDLPKTLPNGINFTLSNEYYFNVDGEFLEGQGVPVDVDAAFFTLEDRQRGQDTALMAAQDFLKN